MLQCPKTKLEIPMDMLEIIYYTDTYSTLYVQNDPWLLTCFACLADTYVKLIMLDSKGKQMSKCKTSVCRGQPSPSYKETFIFQVALFQLSEVTLQVSVYSRRSSMKRRERLGWMALGLNSTSEEQEDHWTHMRESEGQQVCQWHTLMDT